MQHEWDPSVGIIRGSVSTNHFRSVGSTLLLPGTFWHPQQKPSAERLKQWLPFSLRPLEKKMNMSSSDGSPLKPTRRKKRRKKTHFVSANGRGWFRGFGSKSPSEFSWPAREPLRAPDARVAVRGVAHELLQVVQALLRAPWSKTAKP